MGMVRSNIDDLIERLRAKADKGDAAAMYRLACHLATLRNARKFRDECVRLLSSAARAALRKAPALQACPACESGEGYSQHEFVLLATLVLDKGANRERVSLFESIKEHRWPDLLNFQSWESTSDDLEVYAIRCVKDRLVIGVIRAPTELFEPDTLVYYDVLNFEDSRELINLMAPTHRWRSFLQ